MKILIVGLGLIGGSYAKAIKKYTRHTVIGIDNSQPVLNDAKKCGAIDEKGDLTALSKADLIILGLYPADALEFIEQNGKLIKKGCIVTDCAGTKSLICPKMQELSHKNGFKFISSHPMAGRESSGFYASEEELFLDASFIIIPGEAELADVSVLIELGLRIGFGEIKFSTVQEHDAMIAFTSQLPHVLACAYVLSPRCKNHSGFSAGSYRDVSRVAKINAELWSQLFIENKEELCNELNVLIDNINLIKNSIENKDAERLESLLQKAASVKEELGE